MKPHGRWWRWGALLGVCCSSLCVLALPLVVAFLPVSLFGWVHDERLTRAMLVMFLFMTLLASVSAIRHHHRTAPPVLALAGAAGLAATMWRLIPVTVGWVSLAALLAGSAWDWHLMRGMHPRHAGARRKAPRRA